MIRKKKHTKWIPFGNYKWAGEREMIVFVRKNLRTGMMQFIVKKVNKYPLFGDSYNGIFIPKEIIDVKKAWDEIVNLNN